jgi:hypothetical protein
MADDSNVAEMAVHYAVVQGSMASAGYEARALDERATSRKVHIHQGREA